MQVCDEKKRYFQSVRFDKFQPQVRISAQFFFRKCRPLNRVKVSQEIFFCYNKYMSRSIRSTKHFDCRRNFSYCCSPELKDLKMNKQNSKDNTFGFINYIALKIIQLQCLAFLCVDFLIYYSSDSLHSFTGNQSKNLVHVLKMFVVICFALLISFFYW